MSSRDKGPAEADVLSLADNKAGLLEAEVPTLNVGLPPFSFVSC